MGPPSTKKKPQPSTPPMFQKRTAERTRPPSLAEHEEPDQLPEAAALTSEMQNALQAVRSLFKTELAAAVADFARQINDLGDRVDKLEQITDEHTTALQEDQKQIMVHQDQILHKVEDLENHSRRGNLRVRGVPETVTDITHLMEEVL
ncbi:hypothetical protein XELAEV_18033232mg [Xenopus laevis]|uniref:Uncharacterized protein n=1 Tax=Xenopus laevis TaxID=8355 RepID=A0A974CJ72_XENLA|nr:hypothetical protein XELAEV_18033232mg [Xenopus laevis]